MRPAPDPCTWLAERAAIMEYDGGLSRTEAERKARWDLETYEQRSKPKQMDLFGGDGQ